MKKNQLNEIEQARKIADKFGDILEAEHATNYSAVLAACAIITNATNGFRIADDRHFFEMILTTINENVE